ncbi:hypothetical protein CSA56_11510 [candidate division KSB3 bacterium]|uniref:Uncharacterized protein n=1 Tax=candidate division KSB3 bacterium TaxID=2044937 RepID=A0A2G6KD31_9BACT|nr:MAG: hypothetical protein CSA56_11510 [candidate division KSB3 bacterium]
MLTKSYEGPETLYIDGTPISEGTIYGRRIWIYFLRPWICVSENSRLYGARRMACSLRIWSLPKIHGNSCCPTALKFWRVRANIFLGSKGTFGQYHDNNMLYAKVKL